jgi:hypothetical protein
MKSTHKKAINKDTTDGVEVSCEQSHCCIMCIVDRAWVVVRSSGSMYLERVCRGFYTGWPGCVMGQVAAPPKLHHGYGVV